jgi:regulator of PEP synthase PpsR (kinase-PPPase family)
MSKKSNDFHSHKENKKWDSFTQVEKEVHDITKLFRKQNLGVALQTKNNIGKF